MPFAITVDPLPGLLLASPPGVPGDTRRLDFFEDIYGRLATVRENGSVDVAGFRYKPYAVEARNAAQLQPERPDTRCCNMTVTTG
jgi:hypothetical protein